MSGWPLVRMRLRGGVARLLVLVSAASLLPVLRKDAAPGEGNGRGLVLVEELPDRWR